ncbi:MAG TPA: hypothetical protein VIM17_06150, partial [Jatrophihabitantaceae bacterium]
SNIARTTDRPQGFSPYSVGNFPQDDLRNATAENEAQGDPKASTGPKTNALVAAQFALTRDPKRNATRNATRPESAADR